MALALWAAVPGHGAQRAFSPEVEAFIQEMVRKHRFEDAALRRVFSQARVRPAILRAIAAPGTARPWHEFRSRHVDEGRIAGGLRFWEQHAGTLARAVAAFGVPAEIIVATIGIETRYGRHTGSFRVLDALKTLAFHYPPRAELFASELEEYLLFAREAGIDLLRVQGSFAGAIGIPQFLPSSYRRYAVDFDGDGRIDLVGSAADAIGSVANYYRAFGWRAGEAVVVPAALGEANAEEFLAAGIRPHLSVAEFRERGISPLAPVPGEARAALFAVEAEEGPRYWLGLENFYVITRYNRSINYALAVHELAQELRALVKPER